VVRDQQNVSPKMSRPANPKVHEPQQEEISHTRGLASTQLLRLRGDRASRRPPTLPSFSGE
jgi:hypothetical protein